MDDSQKGTQPSRLPWLLLGLVIVSAALAGAMAYRSLEALLSRNRQLEAEAKDAEARLHELQTVRSTMEGRLKELEQQGHRLASERDALHQQLERKDARLSELESTVREVQEKMKAEIGRGDIRLKQAHGRLQVDLVDKILFDSGQAALSPRGAEVLGRLGAVLAKVSDRTIQVSGHTDDSPPSERLAATYPTNWELSVARAVNVVRFLSEKTQVPARRLVATGHGQFQPIATNANPQGRARNRRIEILLAPAFDVTKPPKPAAAKAATSRSPVAAKPTRAKRPER